MKTPVISTVISVCASAKSSPKKNANASSEVCSNTNLNPSSDINSDIATPPLIIPSAVIAGSIRTANDFISLLKIYGNILLVSSPANTLLITVPIFSRSDFMLSKSLSPISTIEFDITCNIFENSLSSTKGRIFPFSSKIKIGI